VRQEEEEEFDHEDMPVYRLALEAYGELVPLVAPLPWLARWVGDQSLRACGSIVLNTAEGAGEHSVVEKALTAERFAGGAVQAGRAQPVALKANPPMACRKGRQGEGLCAVVAMGHGSGARTCKTSLFPTSSMCMGCLEM
jgi:hypothetical protein